MKFGKRRWEDKLDAKVADDAKSPAPAPPAPIAESWNVPAEPEPEPETQVTPADAADEPAVDGEAVELPLTDVPPEESAEPAAVAPEPEPAPVAAAPEPAPEPEPEPAPEPVRPPSFGATRVSPIPPPRAPGEPLPPPGARWAPTPPPPAPPAPPPMPFPVAEEPVLVYTSGSDSPAVTPLAATGEAYASGHAPGTSPSWPEPVLQLANERPEVLVGAAFAGGLLFAMILRRLGN
ncbi:MAG TPA: hypothetical protein VL120_06455 [Solirubrobacteraceae bacterium]|jgi:hypothetical protein|nr:hypothetical protein [Solirubrobacteraceae bacterium]